MNKQENKHEPQYQRKAGKFVFDNMSNQASAIQQENISFILACSSDSL